MFTISNDTTDNLLIFLIYNSYFDTTKFPHREIEYRVMNELTSENFYRNFSLANVDDVLGKSDVSRDVALLQ